MIDHNVESSAYHLRGRDTFLLYLSQFVSLETAGILTINLSTRDVYLEFHEGSYILPSKQTTNNPISRSQLQTKTLNFWVSEPARKL